MKSLLLLLLLTVLGNGEERSPCRVNQRVLGGENVEEGEFPGVVFVEAVYRKWSRNIFELCGGSLISEFWVLTAAHCLTEEPSLQFVKVYPTRNYTYFIQSKDIIVHENYRVNSRANDIGLIRLSNSMSTIDPHFKTVSLPAQGQSLTSNEVTLVGWGITSTTDLTDSQHLKKVEHVALNQSLCQYVLVSEAEALCRYATMATGDTCSGDSGGPVFMDGQAVGVVGGALETSIGIIAHDTRISAQRNWIDTKIRS